VIYDVKSLWSKKKSNQAIFLGCGPSINDITDEQWRKIDSMDVWVSNNWYIHDVVPDFYHLEVKLHRNGEYSAKKIKERKQEEEYANVNWILDKTRPYLFDIVGTDPQTNIYAYSKSYRGNDGFYTPTADRAQVSCGASVTIIMDLMQKMNYEKIYFCGVDLYSSEYFWTNNDKYKDRDVPYLISTCKPDERAPKEHHPTLKTAKFIKEFGEHNKINFVNLSKKSELRKYIPTEEL
jgi:hypothetical protein|tara:strand:+ start:136 stop:843 length:708 start_codon:yes stop_codon:yes gene_type:complete